MGPWTMAVEATVVLEVKLLADLTCRPPLNWVGGKGAIRDIVRLVSILPELLRNTSAAARASCSARRPGPV